MKKIRILIALALLLPICAIGLNAQEEETRIQMNLAAAPLMSGGKMQVAYHVSTNLPDRSVLRLEVATVSTNLPVQLPWPTERLSDKRVDVRDGLAEGKIDLGRDMLPGMVRVTVTFDPAGQPGRVMRQIPENSRRRTNARIDTFVGTTETVFQTMKREVPRIREVMKRIDGLFSVYRQLERLGVRDSAVAQAIGELEVVKEAIRQRSVPTMYPATWYELGQLADNMRYLFANAGNQTPDLANQDEGDDPLSQVLDSVGPGKVAINEEGDVISLEQLTEKRESCERLCALEWNWALRTESWRVADDALRIAMDPSPIDPEWSDWKVEAGKRLNQMEKLALSVDDRDIKEQIEIQMSWTVDSLRGTGEPTIAEFREDFLGAARQFIQILDLAMNRPETGAVEAEAARRSIAHLLEEWEFRLGEWNKPE